MHVLSRDKRHETLSCFSHKPVVVSCDAFTSNQMRMHSMHQGLGPQPAQSIPPGGARNQRAGGDGELNSGNDSGEWASAGNQYL